jgi:hypothetical protein
MHEADLQKYLPARDEARTGSLQLLSGREEAP